MLARCGDRLGLRRGAAGIGALVGLNSSRGAGRLFCYASAVPGMIARCGNRFGLSMCTAGIGAGERLYTGRGTGRLLRHSAAVQIVVIARAGGKAPDLRLYVRAACRLYHDPVIVCRVVTERRFLGAELYAARDRRALCKESRQHRGTELL